MKQRTLQPVEGNSTPGLRKHHPSIGAHRWSFRRLGQDLIARKLDAAMQGMVRREKYLTAQIVSIRIACELEEPLRNLERNIAALEQFAEQSLEARQVVTNLQADRHAILVALRRLREIEPPAESHGWEAA